MSPINGCPTTGAIAEAIEREFDNAKKTVAEWDTDWLINGLKQATDACLRDGIADGPRMDDSAIEAHIWLKAIQDEITKRWKKDVL